MSTITLEIEPKLVRQAENILRGIGLKYSDAVNLFTRQIVIRNALPLELKGDDRPPIPCIDDMTEEELDVLIQESVESIRAGRTYTFDDAKKILGVE